MLTYTNHLGLYSEQIGPSGQLLGDFPQAFTRLGPVSAAVRTRPRPDSKVPSPSSS
jgi:GH15 family glucan-1,4-alpha-glucosidase